MDGFIDATPAEVSSIMQASSMAFQVYKRKSLRERANFMRTIAANLESLGDRLLEMAMKETNLSKPRLQGELTRTIFQLNSYADACEAGDWLQVRIDTGDENRNPSKPDIRKTQVPLGPVVVFGASNFPFAYSTAGGDTACAFAAGCTVVVKAHPAHPKTGYMVAEAIHKACDACNLPKQVFGHIYGAGNDVGKALVTHQNTKAVAFTGSFNGGKALFDWGNQRQIPIPVFAEMGSVNPVFLLPGKLRENASGIAKMLAASITLSVGQFCTNPGLIIGIESKDLQEFKEALKAEIEQVAAAAMLHSGIAGSFHIKLDAVLKEDAVETISNPNIPGELLAAPAIATVDGRTFMKNRLLQEEIFGPYSLVVSCQSIQELLGVACSLDGQLTTTIIATANEIHENAEFVDLLMEKCGRMILNGVPTGVEVCAAMQHGGPFPATTDARFTAVGADGIRRFSRPVCFQNWNNASLPEELKDGNPLKIWRKVDNCFTQN
ncbi:MAG: aldehyde dehydrogenase (NADP(+)) [Bacteroidota bacterium]